MAHRNLICDTAKDLNSVSNVSAKYAWLASYHNERIDNLEPDWFEVCHVSVEELRISHAEFPLLFEF